MVMIMKTNYNLFIEQEFNNDPELKKMYEEELELLRIAKQISDVRKKQKLTQEQMAQKLGTTQSVVARIEAGKQNVSFNILFKIAEIFHKKLEINFV